MRVQCFGLFPFLGASRNIVPSAINKHMDHYRNCIEAKVALILNCLINSVCFSQLPTHIINMNNNFRENTGVKLIQLLS